MFRILLPLLLLLLPPIRSAGQVRAQLESVLKPGTRLIYGVESNGMEYDYIVTIKNPSGAGGFSWQMTVPVNLSGTVVHSAKALQRGNRMHNYFSGGTETLDDATLSVWISKLACQTLLQPGVQFVMYLHGSRQPPSVLSSPTGPVDLQVLINGKPASIREQAVRKHRPAANVSLTDEEFFTFYPSLSVPLILRMSVGFYIGLKEIRT